MIDFLIKNKLSYSELLIFLSNIFECSIKNIALITEEALNDIDYKINTQDILCLCVYIDVCGDASTMLQIYRSKINDGELFEKISSTAKNSKIPCYIPIDSFDNWLYIDENSESHSARQIPHENQSFFRFENIN